MRIAVSVAFFAFFGVAMAQKELKIPSDDKAKLLIPAEKFKPKQGVIYEAKDLFAELKKSGTVSFNEKYRFVNLRFKGIVSGFFLSEDSLGVIVYLKENGNDLVRHESMLVGFRNQGRLKYKGFDIIFDGDDYFLPFAKEGEAEFEGDAVGQEDKNGQMLVFRDAHLHKTAGKTRIIRIPR